MENKPKVKPVVLSCGCDSLLPFALVFMCYLILHGHLSPGGGFQGGVLMVASVLLVYFGRGYEVTCRAYSYELLHGTEGFASTAYVALAMMGVCAGAQFCQNILYTHGNVGDLYSSGTIFWMNLTVGVKVITGIGSISLMMLSLVQGKEADNNKKEVA